MELWIQGYGSSLANHVFVLMKWTEKKLKIWIIYLEVSNPCPHTRNQNLILDASLYSDRGVSIRISKYICKYGI